MSIFEDTNRHPLAVYDDEMEVHHKDADCRPVHESDYDATKESVETLRDDGYTIHECVDQNL